MNQFAELPGRGPSSPIVVGDRVFITASSGAREDRLHVLCFDLNTGEKLWHRQFWATGHTACHPFGANAAPTPASDGERVFALYSSCELVCFDLDGNMQWLRSLAMEHPSTRNDVGMASSPIAIGGTVIVQLENQGESYAAAIDAATGVTRWRVPRDHSSCWATPIPLPGGGIDGGDAVLFQGRDGLAAHDVATGKKVWHFGASAHTVATGVVADGVVYLTANGLHALRGDAATGKTDELWQEPGPASGNASPIVAGQRYFVTKSSGVLACGDVADGSVLWQTRMTGPFWASPLLADGHIYAVSHRGLLQVVDVRGEEGKVVGEKQLDPGLLACPVAADGSLFIRSDGHLWKFVKPR